MDKKKVLIVGAGFGGIYTYTNLRKLPIYKSLDITIFDKNNYFLYTPMLHEVATGGLDPEFLVTPIREITKKCSAKFYTEKITEIIPGRNLIRSKNNEYDYDYLVLATGAIPSNGNIEGAAKHTIPLKDLDDAINLKNSVVCAFEKAVLENNRNKKKELLTFAVVGAGPTGVELVAELSEFIFDHLVKTYRGIETEDVTLMLINRSDRFLSYFSEKTQRTAYEYLENKLRVKILMNKPQKKVTNEGIYTQNGEFIQVRNIYWAVGVEPGIPEFNSSVNKDPENRLIVNENLRIDEHPNIFAIGDIASGSPMLAYTATTQSKHVALSIQSDIDQTRVKPFKFEPKVKLMSLGQHNAVGEIMGINISGRATWFLWRTIYLSKVLTIRKKIKIALNWTFNLFAPRDISKI